MSNKEIHLNYIKAHGKFTVDCNHIIFSAEEIEILEKFGHWFRALTVGELEPFTDLQRDFVRVARGERGPFSIQEKAWFKYQGRKKIEAEQGSSLNSHYELADDSFYNREMWKQQRKIIFSEVRKTHRE